MNTTQAQQKALDDALVAPVDRLKFGKCNMSLKIDIKPKEATFQVVLDALALTPFYHAFLITADFCPKIPGQVFENLPLEQDILSFIRDLGRTRDITYLTDVNVDYLHQPWRAFATVINECLSGKETGMDKIRLSHAQILWGMFHNKNIDYVYLLWEDLLFKIEYKNAKKTNKMSYPRFTKIIINYFMSKDPSISRRNKMFWLMLELITTFLLMRCISRNEVNQGIWRWLQNHKVISQKKADSDTSPKKKPVQATKRTRLKSKAKVAKPDKKKQPSKKTKTKGLDVLFEVALTEAEQIKLAPKRSKKDFHVSHASGSGDGVDTQSKVPDEQQQKTSGTNKGTGTIPGVPNVPPYESKSDKESWGDSEDEDDNDDDYQTEHEEEEEDDDEFYEEEEEEENIDDEETMYDEEDDVVTKELYDDVNVNLGNEDTDMTIADQGALDQQNVSQFKNGASRGRLLIKLLNLDNPSHADNEIASLMGTTTQHAAIIPKITSSFTTTVPPPPPFLHLL
ncbi:hypothetical protein Tco_0450829 [Tanacetum coccineum]